uniref:Uncharacterized protein n=1 Tax=Anopheles coluzzii TaxID=1518534 RepID=A0A8W7P6S0_ANOCL
MAEHLMPSIGSSLGRLLGMGRRSVLGYESLSQTCPDEAVVHRDGADREFGHSYRQSGQDGSYLGRLIAPLVAGFGKVVDMPVSKQFSNPAVIVVRRLNSIKTTTSKTSAQMVVYVSTAL